VNTGVNLTGILGERTGEPKRLGRGEEWGSPIEGSAEGAAHSPEKKMNFSYEMACFGEF